MTTRKAAVTMRNGALQTTTNPDSLGDEQQRQPREDTSLQNRRPKRQNEFPSEDILDSPDTSVPSSIQANLSRIEHSNISRAVRAQRRTTEEITSRNPRESVVDFDFVQDRSPKATQRQVIQRIHEKQAIMAGTSPTLSNSSESQNKAVTLRGTGEAARKNDPGSLVASPTAGISLSSPFLICTDVSSLRTIVDQQQQEKDSVRCRTTIARKQTIANEQVAIGCSSPSRLQKSAQGRTEDHHLRIINENHDEENQTNSVEAIDENEINGNNDQEPNESSAESSDAGESRRLQARTPANIPGEVNSREHALDEYQRIPTQSVIVHDRPSFANNSTISNASGPILLTADLVDEAFIRHEALALAEDLHRQMLSRAVTAEQVTIVHMNEGVGDEDHGHGNTIMTDQQQHPNENASSGDEDRAGVDPHKTEEQVNRRRRRVLIVLAAALFITGTLVGSLVSAMTPISVASSATGISNNATATTLPPSTFSPSSWNETSSPT